MSKDWWDGAKMLNNGFDPYDELQQLKIESIRQRNTINQLVQNNNKLQDLLLEISEQHRNITVEYGNFNKKLTVMQQHIKSIENNTIVLTNDIEHKIQD